MLKYLVRLEVKEVDDAKLVNGVSTVLDYTYLDLTADAASVIMAAFKGLGDIANGKAGA